jgi:surface antigen
MKYAIAICLSVCLVSPVRADPPSHAPAHGYRDKQDKRDRDGRKQHRGYTGVEWADDHGVASGRCNTDTVLTAVGAVGGAVIGNRTASPENRTVATIVGAIAGGIIGNQIGEAIDDRDRACMGHGLEITPVGRVVAWTNPRTQVQYQMRPVRNLADGCRLFEYRAGERGKMVAMTACRGNNGAWAVRRGN